MFADDTSLFIEVENRAQAAVKSMTIWQQWANGPKGGQCHSVHPNQSLW